uniref:Proliferating cell nuclear antigen PCNA N-terminal domain-containing protein n=1 Tax=viral metagenome TaxID=1070528 RepID=A0A6C0M123_9ZZZZ
MESLKSPKDYIFYAYTREGYVIKGIIDTMLNNLTKDATITFDEHGVHSSCADAHSVVLVSFDLLRKNFQNYICEYRFTGNFVLKELHKTVKVVRKKDSITMYVRKDQPTKLVLVTSPQIVHDAPTSGIVSSESVIFSLSEPIVHSSIDSYEYPYTMSSSNFQKVAKKMASTIKGDNVDLHIQGTTYVRFYCTNGINESMSEFGTKADTSGADGAAAMYKGRFYTTMFGNLLKLQALAKELKIYAPVRNNKHPVKIEVNAGGLGTLSIYLKSCECIDTEKHPGTHHTAKGKKKL